MSSILRFGAFIVEVPASLSPVIPVQMSKTRKNTLNSSRWWFIAAVMAVVLQSQSVQAQSVQEILKKIQQVISTEDVSALVAMASDPLDIAAFGAAQTYSRTQGVFVLRDIFDSIDVHSFNVVDYSESVNGLFIEGDAILRASARSTKVYVRLKRSSNKWSIREILIERMEN